MNKIFTSRRTFINNSLALITGTICYPSTLFPANVRLDDNLRAKVKNLVFLFQGDSITDGNRGRSLDPNHIMGHGYAYSVSSRIGADFPDQGFEFYNRGISGNKVSDLLKRWEEDTIALKPDVLSILVGINDVIFSVNTLKGESILADFEQEYRFLLQKARRSNPEVLLVLGLPFVYPISNIKNNWDLYEKGVSQQCQVIKKLANEFDAILLDYKLIFDQAIKKMPVNYWIWDGIHPTVFGHELMSRYWIEKVSERIKFLKFYVK
ncbi:SGNH/GDSL hydrolase family protein [Sphingobacterium kitahiroshimense]|uniref:SGNH/GDSL hydrolase family protein n=1 Tax=Sphingobacterium sp. B16(2022) TaxID=2914044 RepID=UPI001439B42A|nr:SGNH/GDSL hydrolase family protein [Sphingobacterium sp. B16(2022)]NJI74241.1 SGNH/GDSL hydrolase family protein [Sphingobacterium sp. B16(2022)]